MHSAEVQEGGVMTELFLWVLSWRQALEVLPSQPTARGACLQAETGQPECNFWAGAMALPSPLHAFQAGFPEGKLHKGSDCPILVTHPFPVPAEHLAQKAHFSQMAFDKSLAL